jgi:hypothetical protein
LPTSAPPAYDPDGMHPVRACVAWVVLLPFATGAHAGTLFGKLDLPAVTERPPLATKGFLDRSENALAPVRPINFAQQLVVVLEGEEKPVSPGQVIWELVGESFNRPVAVAPAGAEVVIKNVSKTARSLVAKEDAKLVQAGPINPSGTKPFRVPEAGKVYTIGDPDAPHLKGTLVVVNTQFFAYVDDTGRYEISDVPAGAYKLKIWYRDGWLARPDDSVDVSAKGKTDFNPKVPAGSLAPAKK